MPQTTYSPGPAIEIRPGRDRPLTVDGVLWDALDRIAVREGLSLTALVAEIDRRRGQTGIQSALRTVALGYLRAASARHGQPVVLEAVLGQLNPS